MLHQRQPSGKTAALLGPGLGTMRASATSVVLMIIVPLEHVLALHSGLPFRLRLLMGVMGILLQRATPRTRVSVVSHASMDTAQTTSVHMSRFPRPIRRPKARFQSVLRVRRQLRCALQGPVQTTMGVSVHFSAILATARRHVRVQLLVLVFLLPAV